MEGNSTTALTRAVIRIGSQGAMVIAPDPGTHTMTAALWAAVGSALTCYP